jgi:hypothetical protein
MKPVDKLAYRTCHVTVEFVRLCFIAWWYAALTELTIVEREVLARKACWRLLEAGVSLARAARNNPFQFQILPEYVG